MELISRAEAKARGLKRYFTGKPCSYGHIAQRNLWGVCLLCYAQKRVAKVHKPCIVCGREFKARDNNHLYCCTEHRKEAERPRARIRAQKSRVENPDAYRAAQLRFRTKHREKINAQQRETSSRIRPCLFCGREFRTSKSHFKYCCTEHQKQMEGIKARAYAAETRKERNATTKRWKNAHQARVNAQENERRHLNPEPYLARGRAERAHQVKWVTRLKELGVLPMNASPQRIYDRLRLKGLVPTRKEDPTSNMP